MNHLERLLPVMCYDMNGRYVMTASLYSPDLLDIQVSEPWFSVSPILVLVAMRLSSAVASAVFVSEI